MSPQQHESFEVIVVGGGVIGLSVAWRAARQGMSVAVLERGAVGSGASGVAAGMLAPVSEAAFGEHRLLAIGLDSSRRWPSFVAELEADSDRDGGYRECGTLMVAADPDQAAWLERELEFRRSLELDVERLLPSEARRREPALAPTLRLALDVPYDCAADPRLLVEALAQAVRRQGGTLREHAEVAELIVSGGRTTGVRLAGGEVVGGEQIVLAAGAWTGELSGLPGDVRVPVRPVKGQLLRLRDPTGAGVMDRVLRTEECYLVPRGDGRYVLGATMEERGFDVSVTAGAIYELLRAAGEVVPWVWELEIEEMSAGLRPGTPDNLPIIGRSALDGLLWATGHHRNGILLAPVTADRVVAALSGADDEDGVCSPARFSSQVAA